MQNFFAKEHKIKLLIRIDLPVGNAGPDVSLWSEELRRR